MIILSNENAEKMKSYILKKYADFCNINKYKPSFLNISFSFFQVLTYTENYTRKLSFDQLVKLNYFETKLNLIEDDLIYFS